MTIGDRYDDIDYKLIRFFIEVVKSGSFVEAAIALDLERSTITKRIDRLEASLDLQLFDRQRHKITLTEAGHATLSAAQQFVSAGIKFRNAVDDIRRCETSTLMIFAPPSLSSFWLIPAFAPLMQEHPRLRVRIEEPRPADDDPFAFAAAAGASAIEIGTVARLAGPWNSRKLCRLHFRPLASRAFLRRHGLAGPGRDWETRDLARLAPPDPPSVQPRPPSNNPHALEAPAFAASSDIALYHAVRNGLGVAVLPTCFATLDENLVVLPSSDRRHTDLFLTYRKECESAYLFSEAVRAIIQALSPKLHYEFRDRYVAPGPTRRMEPGPIE